MSNLTTAQAQSDKIEQVLLQGDLARLNSNEKISYIGRVCESLGLNSLTKPFDIIKFQGREILYARRDACEQLRKIHSVSIKITAREKIEDMYIVTAQASMPNGRIDESTGVLSIAGLKGEALSNALMKCETKAKRRATLSICGLGFMDEMEIETQVAAEREARTEALQTQIENNPGSFVAEDYFSSPEPHVPEPGDYVLRIGKDIKGKSLSQIPLTRLSQLVQWFDKQKADGKTPHPDVEADLLEVKAFLNYMATMPDGSVLE